jgi:subtilase family serine protease
VASQYDSNSPNFHQWLSPEQVGANFGPSQTDIATISNWLTGHGFTINDVPKDRMSIRFSGTAAQVESTFHTEIHNLEVSGVAHIGNMSDPQIPAALVPAVVGVKGLHNFFPKPLHTLGSQVTRSDAAGKFHRLVNAAPSGAVSPRPDNAAGVHPQFTVNDPTDGLVEDVVPYDFATIYNVAPLWTAGTDGTGQTIAIAGTSDINPTDISNFRSSFGLPAGLPPIQIKGANGTDPGICTSTSSTAVCGIGDLIENSLDVEWSGAVAKGAQIVLVTSGSNSVTDDTVYDSSSYVIQHKTATVLNVSYGLCELFNGAASNAAYNALWQTAASAGIAVFVAAGDQGSTVCDYGNPSYAPLTLAPAIDGLAVSGLASSPYDTAVGGTDFNWCIPVLNSSGNATGCSTSAPYWGTSNNSTTLASALGYIPEVPWNNTCTTPASVTYLESVATLIGVTGVTDAETSCNFIANYYRYIDRNYGADLSYFVNVIGGSGGASNCANNTTVINANGTETVGSCTSSYAKPTYQTALTPSDGERDLPDVSFFAANGFWNSSYLICVSEAGSACSYSANSENTYQEVGGTSVASPAMAGVMALINQKSGSAQGSPNTKLYALAAEQNYGSCSSESVTVSSSCYFNDVDKGTNAMPCAAGSPNCTVLYTGDVLGVEAGYSATTGYDRASGLGSLNVANVVNAWSASIAPTFALSGTSVTITAGATTGNTSTISVTPSNGFTGSVSLSCAVTTVPSGAISPVTCSIPSPVSVTGTAAATAILTVGSTATTSGGAYAITVTGTSGSIAQSAVVNVTVNGIVVVNGIFSLAAAAPSPASISPGSTSSTTVTVSSSNLYVGTVTPSCGLTTYPSGATDLPSCSVSSSNSTVTLSSGTTTGTVIFTVSTTAATSELVRPKMGNGRGWAGAGGGAVLAFLVFLGIPARRRSWRSMLGILVLTVALGSLAGCGGGGSSGTTGQSNPGTTAGNYTFTVTGVGNPAPGTAAASTPFTVTVN